MTTTAPTTTLGPVVQTQQAQQTAAAATRPTTATTSTTASSTDAAQQQIAGTLDSFLRMLTTQLQNQDPISPMETTEFTNQLVGFATVEQAIAQNRRLDQLIGLQSGGRLGEALGYLGHTVEVAGDGFAYTGGEIGLTYSLPRSAHRLAYEIVAETGNVVWRGSAPTTAGRHVIEWDGSTQAGTAAPAGNYQLRVNAVTESGEPVPATTYTTGRVTGAETRNGETVLMIGTAAIALGDVLAVRSDTPS